MPTQQPLRWGILAPGIIAQKFAMGIEESPGSILQAIGSRSLERAEKFNEEFPAISCYGNYQLKFWISNWLKKKKIIVSHL